MFWRVQIDERVYEGAYRAKADAVFGALLKDANDRATTNWTKDIEGNLIAVECINTGSKHPKHKAKRIFK